MVKKIIMAAIIGLIVSVFLAQRPSFAATFDLTYRLTEGGNSLEFNMDNLYKQVDLSVNVDPVVPYKVVQRIIAPIMDRSNPGRNIDHNFVFKPIIGRNSSGTLNAPENERQVGNGEEDLYTSDGLGNPDNFSLLYGIREIDSIESGLYEGTIGFILRPTQSNQEQVLKTVNVSIYISRQNIKPQIEIVPMSGLNKVILNSKKEGAGFADVKVKISGSFKNKFNIAQTLSKAIESVDGIELDPGVINLKVGSVDKGDPGASSGLLLLKPQIIYASAFNGDADDEFVITYSLGDLSGQKAGRYRSLIQYFLDDAQTQQLIQSLEIEVENEPVFDLTITFPNQASGIDFYNLRPKGEPSRNEVVIEISNNTGKNYQVSQKSYSGLRNKEGNAIVQKNFTLFTEPFEVTKGSLRNLAKTEIGVEDMVLFISDNKGSPDKFKVIYELDYPEDARAGDYSTQITYSLSEL